MCIFTDAQYFESYALSGHTSFWKVVQAGCLPDSLMLRPHPAHVARRGVVSQAQIFGLATET